MPRRSSQLTFRTSQRRYPPPLTVPSPRGLVVWGRLRMPLWCRCAGLVGLPWGCVGLAGGCRVTGGGFGGGDGDGGGWVLVAAPERGLAAGGAAVSLPPGRGEAGLADGAGHRRFVVPRWVYRLLGHGVAGLRVRGGAGRSPRGRAGRLRAGAEQFACLGGDLVHGRDEFVEASPVGDLLAVTLCLFRGEPGGDGLAGDLAGVLQVRAMPGRRVGVAVAARGGADGVPLDHVAGGDEAQLAYLIGQLVVAALQAGEFSVSHVFPPQRVGPAVSDSADTVRR